MAGPPGERGSPGRPRPRRGPPVRTGRGASPCPSRRALVPGESEVAERDKRSAKTGERDEPRPSRAAMPAHRVVRSASTARPRRLERSRSRYPLGRARDRQPGGRNVTSRARLRHRSARRVRRSGGATPGVAIPAFADRGEGRRPGERGLHRIALTVRKGLQFSEKFRHGFPAKCPEGQHVGDEDPADRRVHVVADQRLDDLSGQSPLSEPQSRRKRDVVDLKGAPTPALFQRDPLPRQLQRRPGIAVAQVRRQVGDRSILEGQEGVGGSEPSPGIIAPAPSYGRPSDRSAEPRVMRAFATTSTSSRRSAASRTRSRIGTASAGEPARKRSRACWAFSRITSGSSGMSANRSVASARSGRARSKYRP